MCKTILLFLTGIFCTTIATANELDLLVQRAMQKDSSVFINDYTYQTFCKWQQRMALHSVQIDSLSHKGIYDEIYIRGFCQSQQEHVKTAWLITTKPERKIVSVRKSVLTLRGDLHPFEHDVVEFIERFAWIYDIGDNGFLYDFFYPEYVNLRYLGFSDTKKIIDDLREQYPGSLPISEVNWESQGSTFLINLIIDSPLKPLQLAVDVRRYITSQYFDFEDRFMRVQTLADSIELWLRKYRSNTIVTPVIISAPSAKQAMAMLLDFNFQNYNTLILEQSENDMLMESTLEPVHGLMPAVMKYKIHTLPIDMDKYTFKVERIDNQYDLAFLSRDSTKPVHSYDPMVLTVLNSTLQRYGASSLPAVFQPDLNSTHAGGQIIFGGTQMEEIKFQGMDSYIRFIQKMATNRIPYVFPHRIQSENEDVEIKVVTIWKNPNLQWHHLADVSESYKKVEAEYVLDRIVVHLYPFVRTENLHAFVTLQDSSSHFENKITVSK